MTVFLARIDVLNPALNDIVSLRPHDELMQEARQVDQEAPKGWLHGIPFAVKDLVDTAGIPSTNGSSIYANHIPEKGALLAARIRAAGAIIIGKTNTPEFGLGSHSYNPVRGVTCNPYDQSKLAKLLDTIARPDPRIPNSDQSKPNFAAEPVRPAEGKRIGWIGDWGVYYPIEPEILSLCEQGLQVLLTQVLGLKRLPLNSTPLCSGYFAVRRSLPSGDGLAGSEEA